MSAATDVIVVGAGPVGCGLALLLADRGRTVVVVERHDGPYPLPRAVHFDDETARILQACGIGDRLPKLSEPADVYEWRNAEGLVLLRFELSELGACGWPSANMFNQPDLELELFQRLDAHPNVTMRRSTAAVGYEQDADGVRLTVSTDGVADTLEASYLVGCDGANSTIRQQVDPPFEDHGFFFDWLVVDVALHEPRAFDPVNLQVCDPTRPTTIVSGGPGRRRWEFMCLPGESLDALDEVASAWEMLEPWDVTPDNATMVRHAGYRFQAKWATRWRDGRVFLAGDAAHLTPPFAGQGMCAGLRDAINLAWKLDHVLSHPDDVALLDTYDAERVPQAAQVIEFAMELGKVICVPDPAEATARDEAMGLAAADGSAVPIAAMPPIAAGLLDLGTPAAGELFVQGRVDVGAGPQRFDDVFGAGWRLVTDGAAAVPEELAAWFTSIGGRIVGVGDGADATDVDGTYRQWFDAQGVASAVQRPDFAVFASGDPTTVLADLRRRL
ncbi:MAG: bifunctional 3-(3-hydroxy-phenyl)propionate/3-hydroxycinnamic acid hydroxylase [Acidimicrobiales bacterium]